MKAQMMDFPLTLTHILERGARFFAGKQIATRTPEGVHRCTYAALAARARQLAGALARLGIRRGDRVATLAWNHQRHLELYFGVPCSGAVLHTLNIRLHPEQLAYIINHAEDRVIFADSSLLPLLAPIRDQLKTVEHVVVLDSSGSSEPGYEALLEAADPEAGWPALDENSAAILCYTSGTTGNPKGVVYSHRALFLHSMAVAQADTFALSERDVVLPVVPMFHANSWGVPFCCAMVGASLVFTGSFLQPQHIAGLILQERVSIAFGVPAIWNGLTQYLEQTACDLSTLRMMVIGGSAVPRSMIEYFQRKHGVPIVQAWGMTETGPLGTLARVLSTLDKLDEEAKYRLRATQGRPVPGVELRAVDDQGVEVPWDGKTRGEVQVRGPWVASSYYRLDQEQDAWRDGWLRTGDVATIQPDGYMQIADRVKDLIKSGGEWISSVDLENTIMGHPKVLEACVVAVPHARWDERPLACVVPRPEYRTSLTAEEIRQYLEPRVARWWLPDAVEFLESIPKTGVGKFDKKELRRRFKDYRL